MYSAKLHHNDAGFLALTDFSSDYLVTEITGLGPSSAHINTTDLARVDGSVLNSYKLNPRTIVITLYLTGDIEAARQQVYNYFRTKEPARFYFANGSRSAYIDGYVQGVEVDLFSMSEFMVLTLFCPDPYFQADETETVSLAFEPKRFYFPFAIDQDDPVEFSVYDEEQKVSVPNDSDTPAELEIEAVIYASIQNLTIRNLTTGEHIEIAYAFQPSDVLTITTGRKKKSIKLTRNSSTWSLMGYLAAGSTFPVLAPGDNEMNYSADNGSADGSVEVTVTYHRRYRGL